MLQTTRSKRTRLQRWLYGGGLCLALVAALSGCVAHARGEIVYGYEAEYVEAPPPRIEYYPRTIYRDRPAYWVDGRWYYRDRSRWVAFREEPAELREYRLKRRDMFHDGRRDSYRSAQRHRLEQRRIEQRRAEERRAREERRRLEASRQLEERRRAAQRAEERRREARGAERWEQERRFANPHDDGRRRGRDAGRRDERERKRVRRDADRDRDERNLE